MGRYVRQFDVPITFDDELITVTLRQASQEEVFSMKADGGIEMLKGFRAALSDAILEIKGPTDAAGVQVPKDEFLSRAYFAKVVMEIGEKWIERATPQNPSSPAA